MHVHVACVCVTVYWASQLILIISGDDSEFEYPSDVDPYDYLGYSTDFEECADEFDE